MSKKKTDENWEEGQEEQQAPEILKPMLHEGHKLRTRREFMAHGLLGMTAFTLAPSVLMAPGRAHAQSAECAPPVFEGMTPVIIIELAGGGNLPGGNVMVGGPGGQEDFLASYESLGLPADMHPSRSGQLNSELGLRFHSDSGILLGVRSIASNTTRRNIDGAVFCTASSDDTANNQFNPMYWLNKAGAKGQVNQIGGATRSMVPIESENPSIAPVRVTSNRDAMNLVSLGTALNAYSDDKIGGMMDALSRISGNKLNSMSRRSLPEVIKGLLGCSYQQTKAQVATFSPSALDANADTLANTVFANVTNAGIRDRVKPITKLVLDGYVGVGSIVLGGYDYHDGGRASGENRDFELGQVMGAIFELAARKQKDVAIIVITDGGVSANKNIDNSAGGRGKFGWAGDSGQRSASMMMVYKHDGAPNLRNRDRRQIGHFRANGAVETSAALTGNSVVNMSKALVANYLALHGEEGKLESVVGSDPFRLNLDQYLVFDKLR